MKNLMTLLFSFGFLFYFPVTYALEQKIEYTVKTKIGDGLHFIISWDSEKKDCQLTAQKTLKLETKSCERLWEMISKSKEELQKEDITELLQKNQEKGMLLIYGDQTIQLSINQKFYAANKDQNTICDSKGLNCKAPAPHRPSQIALMAYEIYVKAIK